MKKLKFLCLLAIIISSKTLTATGLSNLQDTGERIITANEYKEFLNTTASSNRCCFYDAKMSTGVESTSILRSGIPGSYQYQIAGYNLQTTAPEAPDTPMLFLSWNDAMRYCDWKNSTSTFNLTCFAFDSTQVDPSLKSNIIMFRLVRMEARAYESMDEELIEASEFSESEILEGLSLFFSLFGSTGIRSSSTENASRFAVERKEGDNDDALGFSNSCNNMDHILRARSSSEESIDIGDNIWRDVPSRPPTPGYDGSHEVLAVSDGHQGIQQLGKLREELEDHPVSLKTDPVMNVVVRGPIAEEIDEAKKVANALRQQLILRNYQLILPLSAKRNSENFSEAAKEYCVPKDEQAQLEESMTVIMDDVAEKMRQRCPDNQYANIRLRDLEAAIEKAERVAASYYQVDETSRPHRESQITQTRAILCEMKECAQQVFQNLRVENNPSLAPLAMTEVLKEKVEALGTQRVFQGNDATPTEENIINIRTIFFLSELTLTAAEDALVAASADVLTTSNNEELNKHCTNAAKLVASLRSSLLLLGAITRNLNYRIKGQGNQSWLSYPRSFNCIKKMTSEAVALAQDGHQSASITIREAALLTSDSITDDGLRLLFEKVQENNLCRYQATLERNCGAGRYSNTFLYPCLVHQGIWENQISSSHRESCLKALVSQFELRLWGRTPLLSLTNENMFAIAKKERRMGNMAHKWRGFYSDNEEKDIKTDMIKKYNTVSSDISEHLTQLLKNLNRNDPVSMGQALMAATLTEVTIDKLAKLQGLWPSAMKSKLPDFSKALEDERSALFSWLRSQDDKHSGFSSYAGEGQGALKKINHAIRNILSIKVPEKMDDLPGEAALQESISFQKPHNLSIRHIIVWNEAIKSPDIDQKIKAVRDALSAMLVIHKADCSKVPYYYAKYVDHYFRDPNRSHRDLPDVENSIAFAKDQMNQTDSMIQTFCDFMTLDHQKIGPGQRVFLADVMTDIASSNQLLFNSYEAFKNDLGHIFGNIQDRSHPVGIALYKVAEACSQTYKDAINAMDAFVTILNQEQPRLSINRQSTFLPDRMREEARLFRQQMSEVVGKVQEAVQEVKAAKNRFDTKLQAQLMQSR